jgi:hypothetical protein
MEGEERAHREAHFQEELESLKASVANMEGEERAHREVRPIFKKS